LTFFLPHKAITGEGHTAQQGGYARLDRLIREHRALREDKVLLLDAGDFSMGTLFHSAFMREAAELKLMGEMGYDVTTFGNHDFDFHNDGLTAALNIAGSQGGPLLAATVASSAVFSGDASEASLKEAFRRYPVRLIAGGNIVVLSAWMLILILLGFIGWKIRKRFCAVDLKK
jgi:2',3'-cyclic-nucleotide 2'-phosphodiesterase (5'-nucleotidase family)